MSIPTAVDPGHAEPGLAFLIDYDGTIATVDVTDELVRLSSSGVEWHELDHAYRSGAIGTRALLEAEARLLPHDPTELREVLRDHRHDLTFRSFVAAARAAGATIEIVSDGLGFFVAPAMEALGFGDIPIFAAALEFGPSGPRIDFPAGNPDCHVCGTCKRSRVLEQQAAGRHAVFVGDGFSDQYAVAYADTVFAKGDLADICRERGVAFEPWETFQDIEAWLRRTSDAGGISRPRQHRFICGPEVARERP